MTDIATDVIVTIHGTEMDLIAVGERICAAEPDVGIMRSYVEGWNLRFQDGTEIPRALCDLVWAEEDNRIQEALNEALDRGDFEPDPDRLREDRDECRRLGWVIDENPFKPAEAK